MHNHVENRDNYIVSPEGLWVFKPNKKLIKIFKDDISSFPHDKYNEAGEGREFPSFRLSDKDSDTYNDFMGTLTHNANLYHGKLSYGNDLKKYCEEKDYEPPTCKKITSKQYIKKINDSLLGDGGEYGFDIKLLKWNKPWIFNYPKKERDNVVLNDMKLRNKLINKDINFKKLKKCIDETESDYIVVCK